MDDGYRMGIKEDIHVYSVFTSNAFCIEERAKYPAMKNEIGIMNVSNSIMRISRSSVELASWKGEKATIVL